MTAAVQNAENGKGATVFGYYVDDPERFGIVEFAKNLKPSVCSELEIEITDLNRIYLEDGSLNMELLGRDLLGWILVHTRVWSMPPTL